MTTFEMTTFAPPTEAYAKVDGHGVNVLNPDEAIHQVRSRLLAGRGFTFSTLNLDHLVKLRRDEAFRAAYSRATLVSADGAPVVVMCRTQAPAIQRTTGADLVRPLCQMAAREKIPVAFFGSTMQSLELAAAKLCHEFPGLLIASLVSPPFGFDPASQEAGSLGAQLARSGARLCFVCLGAPKQEKFADRMAQAFPEIGFVSVGAAVDFVAGTQVRAPRLAQAFGMEWLWRLCGNPRRLTSRYVQCALLFGRLLIEARFKPIRARQFVPPDSPAIMDRLLDESTGAPKTR
jgi:exopolysaccharide biosynthesis WecB/TagA/CpsF family protein